LDRCLRYAGPMYILMLLLVTVLGMASMGMAILASTYCVDVDDNTITALSAFTNNTVLIAAAEYYILGAGRTNPLVEQAGDALVQIGLLENVYMQFEGVVNSFTVTCVPLEEIHMKQLVKEARLILGSCITLLQPSNVYPYYDKAVRGILCQDIINSLANFPIFAVILGLVCFPILVVQTHRFLVRWLAWKQESSHHKWEADLGSDEDSYTSFSSSEESDEEEAKKS